jgi:hypothetical protein
MDFSSSTRLRLSFARVRFSRLILLDGLILPRDFKLHIAIDEVGKIVAFRFANGLRHDVKEAENLLRGRIGTAIGDKDYCSQQLKTRLAKTGLRLIAHARKNMKNGNTPKEKQFLRRRNLVERVIAKLKRHIGDSFSRFRAWGAVQATITLGILTLNMGY